MKLLTFGCSMTNHKGFKEELSTLLNAELVNFAIGAGSNGLQIHKFHEYIINNNLNADDIILWQVTVDRRNPIRLQYSPALKKQLEDIDLVFDSDNGDIPHYLTSTNIFDKEDRYDILSCSPIHDEEKYTHSFDYNQHTQTLLANLILAQKYHPRLLVFLGWDTVMATYNGHDKIFIEIAKEKGINILEEPYLTWVNNNNGTLKDDKHPSEESARRYAREVLHPTIKNLGWI